MNIETAIKNAMARMLERDLSLEGVTVSSWDEEFIKGWGGGCDTCDYGADNDSYEVTIIYTYPEISISRSYTYNGTFGDLIKELDSE
jgi:hypothetical protein